MLRPVTIVVALIALIPAVPSMQGLPAQPTPLETPGTPAPMATPPPALPAVATQPTAQTPRAPQPPPRTPQTLPTPGVPPPSTAPAPMQPPRKMRGRDLNVQIELTISDQLANAAPDKRVVSLLIADGAFGRIRSVSSPDPNLAMLNIDARPEILENDRVVVEMTIEYRPLAPDGAGATKRPAALNEQLTVILQNGRTLLVSQAADPLNDRKMTVEVRASIIK